MWAQMSSVCISPGPSPPAAALADMITRSQFLEGSAATRTGGERNVQKSADGSLKHFNISRNPRLGKWRAAATSSASTRAAHTEQAWSTFHTTCETHKTVGRLKNSGVPFTCTVSQPFRSFKTGIPGSTSP
ncbi:hypothetical protein RRG08_035129 [Elysia crispata]|uniref:Uncharacterized protein n=1 Tax=Elysia crispata TaxID=231223 RepID=A0AAE1E063_9GAST|nr:hypothetical protein RRG08_035129 [Elysia crispata]